jgi:hypothetical protein
VLFALLLYGLALFLVLLAALPYTFKARARLSDVLGCACSCPLLSPPRLTRPRAGWALTFPNVGWLTATGALATALGQPGLFALQAAGALALAALWLALAALTLLAVRRGLVLCDAEDAVRADERAGLWGREKGAAPDARGEGAGAGSAGV